MKPKTIKCPKCKGKGEVYLPSTYPPRPMSDVGKENCDHCGGTGKLIKVNAMRTLED